MRNVLLICAILFAFGCGPRGLPVSDLSSYKLDYYDYAKNRLPTEEKIIDGQCLLWLQPAIGAMFAEDYENSPQDTYNAKVRFSGALSVCSLKFLDFSEHVEDIKVTVALNRRQLLKKLQSGQPVTGEDTQEIWRADQALPLLTKTSALATAKYKISHNLVKCLDKSQSEANVTECMEDAARTLEDTLPKE